MTDRPEPELKVHPDLPEPGGTDHAFRPHNPGDGTNRRKAQIATLEKGGMTARSRVLEIGCGIGWLAYDLIGRLDQGSYTGFDIGEEPIAWLNEHYAPVLPNFRFDFFDVRNARYNKAGASRAKAVRFPYPDASFDIVCSFNVFTYLTRAEIANYLRETSRVLSRRGVGLLTFKAVVDGDIGPSQGDLEYVQVDEGTYTRRPNRPGWAMAYDDALIRALIKEAGLRVVDFELGDWHLERGLGAATPPVGSDKARPGPDLYVVKPSRLRALRARQRRVKRWAALRLRRPSPQPAEPDSEAEPGS